MNTDIFTLEEVNLICIYNVGDRDSLINDIRAAIPYIDEPDLAETAVNVIRKLEIMTGAEFSALEFYPEYSAAETEV